MVSWYSLSLVLKNDSVSWIKLPKFSSCWGHRRDSLAGDQRLHAKERMRDPVREAPPEKAGHGLTSPCRSMVGLQLVKSSHSSSVSSFSSHVRLSQSSSKSKVSRLWVTSEGMSEQKPGPWGAYRGEKGAPFLVNMQLWEISERWVVGKESML